VIERDNCSIMSQILLKWCVLVKTINRLKSFCDINSDSTHIIFGITMHMLLYYTILKNIIFQTATFKYMLMLQNWHRKALE
jgi:hypothetical protein